MQEYVCFSCRRPKATLHCEVCQEAVCKKCVHFLDISTFSFLKQVPEMLSHTHYCLPCYSENVEPELNTYTETLERAKGLYVFFETHHKPVQTLKKSKETIRIENCDDRDETILKLAFLAVQEGFNAIIETKVSSETRRNGGHQKSHWSGTAVPALIDTVKLERHRF